MLYLIAQRKTIKNKIKRLKLKSNLAHRDESFRLYIHLFCDTKKREVKLR